MGDAREGGLRVAYADPPYPGCCALYKHHHPDGLCWDDPDTTRHLVDRLNRDFPDGWALSTSSAALRDVLALCPSDVRIAAWVKPFAIFKPNVNPAYAWEPVIFRGGRRRPRTEPTTRDFLAEPVTLGKGLVGAKPPAFCRWVFDLLGLRAGDELVDLYPGTGVVGRTWTSHTVQGRLPA